MTFWIFMTVMDLLIPVTMIGFGRYFMKNAPKDINALFGYRSKMSMLNQDTWEFAHRYCGKLWFDLGVILLPLSVIPMILVYGKKMDTVSLVGLVVCMLQLLPLIGSIIPTEIALKRQFDCKGNKKDF